MARIESVSVSTGLSGFYTDDKAAIKAGATRDGFVYRGEPETEGFDRVRMPGESASVLLELDSGHVAVGDCAVAQYAGSGGRFSPIFGDEMARLVREEVAPLLKGRELSSFRDVATTVDELEVDGSPLHPAVRYGATQAILDARAKATAQLKAEVLSEEFDLPISDERIGINAQTGDQRYRNVDKMILKEVEMMPQGLFNTAEKVGANGEKLLEYGEWLSDRITDVGRQEYDPWIRFDVYGSLGEVFDDDPGAIADYLVDLEAAVDPYRLFVEMPVSVGDQGRQLEAFAELRDELTDRASSVSIIADEYANTLEDIETWAQSGAADMVQVKTIDLGSLTNIVEAVRYCEDRDVLTYQGGTCNETDVSARACVHVAMVSKPTVMAPKPGMGVDEGIMIVTNEMNRILELTK